MFDDVINATWTIDWSTVADGSAFTVWVDIVVDAWEWFWGD